MRTVRVGIVALALLVSIGCASRAQPAAHSAPTHPASQLQPTLPVVPPTTSRRPTSSTPPASSTPQTTSAAPTTDAARPQARPPVPPPASASDAVGLLQGLNDRLAQAAQTADGPQPLTRAEVQAALDAQLRQMGINIPHS